MYLLKEHFIFLDVFTSLTELYYRIYVESLLIFFIMDNKYARTYTSQRAFKILYIDVKVNVNIKNIALKQVYKLKCKSIFFYQSIEHHCNM